MLWLGWPGGQAVDAPVLRPVLTALLVATSSGSATVAAAAPCGMIGASYVSWPPHSGPVYRMKTASLPPGADGSAVLTQWRFRAADLVLPVGRHVVPDLQNRVVWLRRSCGTPTP